MDIGEIGLGGVDWIRLAQGRDWWWAVVSAVTNLRVLRHVVSSKCRSTLHITNSSNHKSTLISLIVVTAGQHFISPVVVTPGKHLISLVVVTTG
jgi:hypothetical protein